jgi:hypothetical protein
MTEKAIMPPPAASKRKSSRPQTARSCFDGIVEDLSIEIAEKERLIRVRISSQPKP